MRSPSQIAAMEALKNEIFQARKTRRIKKIRAALNEYCRVVDNENKPRGWWKRLLGMGNGQTPAEHDK